MDVARFGDFASPEWGTIKSSENYERRFVMTFPNETLPKGRLQKTTALYVGVAKGALMGQVFGPNMPYGLPIMPMTRMKPQHLNATAVMIM